MYTIHLHNCRFDALHGLHNEESVVGAVFEVSLDAVFDADTAMLHIDQTVDYVSLYEIVQKHMHQPVKLLETLAQNIATEIHLADKKINQINIHIKKINPPIAKFTGSVGLSFSKSFVT